MSCPLQSVEVGRAPKRVALSDRELSDMPAITYAYVDAGGGTRPPDTRIMIPDDLTEYGCKHGRSGALDRAMDTDVDTPVRPACNPGREGPPSSVEVRGKAAPALRPSPNPASRGRRRLPRSRSRPRPHSLLRASLQKTRPFVAALGPERDSALVGSPMLLCWPTHFRLSVGVQSLNA